MNFVCVGKRITKKESKNELQKKNQTGVHLNLSGSGVGIGFSPMRGLSFSMNKTGIYNNASLPETGLCKRSKIASFSDNQREPRSYSNNFEDTDYQITMGLDENGKIGSPAKFRV